MAKCAQRPPARAEARERRRPGGAIRRQPSGCGPRSASRSPPCSSSAGRAATWSEAATREPEGGLVEAEPSASRPAQVSATLERHGDAATLHVSELPRLGRDEVYEVWVQRDGRGGAANTFVLGLDGTAEAAMPGPLEGADAVLVTAEPRPGSQQPTTAPVLQAPL